MAAVTGKFIGKSLNCFSVFPLFINDTSLSALNEIRPCSLIRRRAGSEVLRTFAFWRLFHMKQNNLPPSIIPFV